MENEKNFICSLCHRQLELNKGDYLFTYEAECINNHKLNNIELDDLLEKKISNSSIYKCKEHQKKTVAHCFICNEDICLNCIRTSHKGHKNEYLFSLNKECFGVFSNLEWRFEYEKNIINIFISELSVFKEKLNSFINDFKSQLIKEIKLRQDLLKKLFSKEFSYIDIQNVKNLINDDDSIIIIQNNLSKFCKSKTFLEKYDYMRIIFKEVIQRGRFLETPNLLNIIKKFGTNIIPLNKNHFIQFDNEIKSLKIISDNSDLYTKDSKYNIVLSMDSDKYFFNKIILKNNKNIEKEFSFYAIKKPDFYIKEKNNLFEVKIINIFDKEKIKCDIKKIKLNVEKKIISGLIILDNNKNIIIKYTGGIYLYDDLFNEIKMLDKISVNYYLKINENTFVYSSYSDDNNIYVGTIENNEFYKYIIQKCGGKFINYLEKKKILISSHSKFLYIINFNSLFPEVIQKIEINSDFDPKSEFSEIRFIDNIYNYFHDDSIYLILKKKSYEDNNCKWVNYIVQFRIENDGLREISRIEKETYYA